MEEKFPHHYVVPSRLLRISSFLFEGGGRNEGHILHKVKLRYVETAESLRVIQPYRTVDDDGGGRGDKMIWVKSGYIS